MTVTYTAQVATSNFSCFLKLLARWRGSIYKLLWKDFALFAGIYYFLAFLYRFVLTPEQKRIFELISRYCESNNSLIPLAFVLGFFIDLVVTRWWNQVTKIPWPDRMAMFVTASVHGQDDGGRLMRRTIMRYLCLAYVITMSSISPGVRKRFPSFQHMADAGFLLPNELNVLENIKTPHNKYFVPLAWVTSLVQRARKEGRIKDDFAVKTLNDEINEYRGSLGTLFLYDWITIPLVYTQVVTLACYMFFLSCLMGRQFLNDGSNMPDMYFPIFTFLQYFFYMGWLKVAECLINPFGEDDEDFDINSLIDRNLQVSYLIVDEMHNEHPELIKDQYWDDAEFKLPYTVASEPYRISIPHIGSALNINLSVKDKETVPQMSAIDEESRSLSQEAGIDVDSETNSTTKVGSRTLFRLNSITSSIRSGKASLLSSKRWRKISKPVTDTPCSSVQHSHQSIHAASIVIPGIKRLPGSPISQNEEIFEMSDIENENDEEGSLIEPPSQNLQSQSHFPSSPPKIIIAKFVPGQFNRSKYMVEQVASDKLFPSNDGESTETKVIEQINQTPSRAVRGDKGSHGLGQQIAVSPTIDSNRDRQLKTIEEGIQIGSQTTG